MFFQKDGHISDGLVQYPHNDYQTLRDKALNCNRCHLRKDATQVVMGYGDINSKIMFIGEGPGSDEDRIGKPFVGKAGQLLDKVFKAVEIEREKVYISNIVKCRPPGNRNPAGGEVEACAPILKAEIKIIDPLVIIPMGSVALKNLIGDDCSITRMRGKWIQRGKFFIFPTFHPAYLLRNPGAKKLAWHDFLVIKKAIIRINELKKEGKLA